MGKRVIVFVLVLAAAAALLVLLLVRVAFEGEPRPDGKPLRVTLGGAVPSVPFVVRPRAERGVLFAGSAYSAASGAAEATHIDLATGAARASALQNPFDRERYEVFEPVPLRRSFSGIVVPIPRFGLMNWDGGAGLQWDRRLTGRERLLAPDGGATLLARTLVNGRALNESHHAQLFAFQSPDRSLLVCIYSSRRGTTAWVFQEK